MFKEHECRHAIGSQLYSGRAKTIIYGGDYMQREMIVVPYDSNWVNEFERIKKTLSVVFGDLALDIQHFGSTSIIGMNAKAIIDVMVIVQDITQVDGLNNRMRELGYVARGENGMTGRRYFQMFALDGVNHTQHIHCYEKENPHVIDELMFRDYLRVDRISFAQYQNIKKEAAEKYRFSPQEYTDYKSECVERIMEKAKAYYLGSKSTIVKTLCFEVKTIG